MVTHFRLDHSNTPQGPAREGVLFVEEAPTSLASPPSTDLKIRQKHRNTVVEKYGDLMSALA